MQLSSLIAPMLKVENSLGAESLFPPNFLEMRVDRRITSRESRFRPQLKLPGVVGKYQCASRVAAEELRTFQSAITGSLNNMKNVERKLH